MGTASSSGERRLADSNRREIPEGYVYFIKANAGGRGYTNVKIGWARDPRKRLKELQTGNPYPLELIGALPGGRELEREVHEEWEFSRCEGEWFLLQPQMFDRLVEDGEFVCSEIETVRANREWHERRELGRVMRTAGVAGMLLLAALALVPFAGASTPEGSRWPRYDNKPVHIHIVVDQTVAKWMLKPLKDAAKGWQATGDLKFDFPKGTRSCEADIPDTICVSATDTSTGQFTGQPWAGFGGWSWVDYMTLYGNRVVGADGLFLVTYGRIWANTLFVNENDPAWNRHVFCHELGHNIGVGHMQNGPPPYQPSCMTATADFYSVAPSADDLALVHSLYSARDTR